jgi:hypothetical protein
LPKKDAIKEAMKLNADTNQQSAAENLTKTRKTLPVDDPNE